MAMRLAMAARPQTLGEITDKLLTTANLALEYHEQLEESGGELTPEMTAVYEELTALERQLEELDVNLTEKVDAYVAVYRTHRDMAEGIRRAAQTLQARARAHQSTADRIKSWLRSNLEKLGMKKVETYYTVVRIQKSPASVRCEGEIPPAYQRVKVEFDARQALADLREHGLIPAEPGTYEVNGMIVHVGEHMVIR